MIQSPAFVFGFPAFLCARLRLCGGFLAVMLLHGVLFAQTDNDCAIIRTKDLLDPSAPKFADYTVTTPGQDLHPRLDIASNPIAKTYRTVLRNEMKRGPNFAGHYRLAMWGCGSSCVLFAVVNLQSGKVITAPDIGTVSFGNFSTDDFLPEVQGAGGVFRFRKNSNLLVLVGNLNEDESKQGAFYLALKHDRLTLIHQTLVKKTCPR